MMFRGQLRAAGIELRIDSVPAGAYLQKAEAGEFDVAASSLFAADPDVMRRIHVPARRAKTSIVKVSDEELTELLERASGERDLEVRKALYARAQRLVLERTYGIPTYVLIYTVASSTKVQGLAIDQHGFPTFHDAWIRHET